MPITSRESELPINPRLLHPTGQFAGAVRLTMLEHGYALVETPTFLDDDLFLRLTRRKTVLQFHDKRWWKYPKLARYGCWLESLLGKALPEEEVALVYLEFRNEPAKPRQAHRRHARQGERNRGKRQSLIQIHQFKLPQVASMRAVIDHPPHYRKQQSRDDPVRKHLQNCPAQADLVQSH